MKEIIDRLQEKRNIEVAKSILESNGYKVEKKSAELNESSAGAIGAKVGDTIIDTKTGKEGTVQKLGQSGNYGLIYVDFGNGLRKINPMDDAQRVGRYKLKESRKLKESEVTFDGDTPRYAVINPDGTYAGKFCISDEEARELAYASGVEGRHIYQLTFVE